MKTKKQFAILIVCVLLTMLGTGALSASGPGGVPLPSVSVEAKVAAAAGEAIIVDHNTVDITAIPQYWIEEAKRVLHIAYGHTSHGSQVTNGMSGLVGFANGGGKGLALPADIFAWNWGGTGGALDLRDRAMGGRDAGYYPQWVNYTRSYLGTPDPVTGRGTNEPDVNVIIWSWCGQVSGYSEQEMKDWYLDPMSDLEEDYPGVTFVYMTGHADGTGETGNLHLRNQQIRDYVVANNKVLYDFYDIELYDPDGNYYGDKAVNDNCDYDSDGNGSRDRNWALDWQNSHTQNVDWYSCGCAHSQYLNCNQKAYAAWWLWARLAGWSGPESVIDLSSSTKAVSRDVADQGDVLTYTIQVASQAPSSTVVSLTDVLPAGLSYLPGTLTATAGSVDDTAAPTLTWSGVLGPTPVVTVTYVTTVTASASQIITNAVVIDVPGYQAITRTAAITVTPSAPGYLCGDVDGNNQVDIADALLVAQYSTGLDVLSNQTAADVNSDDIVDIVDALLIAQYYVDLPVQLTCK